MVTNQYKIIMGVCVPRSLKEAIDQRCGDIPQSSRYISSIELNGKAQFTLPDIQLKHAGRVSKLYVKSLQDKAVCRSEESLKLDLLLPEALDNIRHLHESSETKLNKILKLIKQEDNLVDTAKKDSVNNISVQSATSNDIAGVNS
jgi:hypothetical protein